MRPKIKCPHCSGKGKMELDNILYGTLLALQAAKAASASKLLEIEFPEATINATAFNKRLERLRALKLVTRKKVGRIYIYSPL